MAELRYCDYISTTEKVTYLKAEKFDANVKDFPGHSG